MKIKHISLFMPTESAFHRRIFLFLTRAFQKQGLEVTGQCGLLSETEMRSWVSEKKPCAIFEMNRVKDEIPILHRLNILHISWVVDMEGRDESHIKGSDITYTFDPTWVVNFKTGGFTAWMPPGTCMETFFPGKEHENKEIEFCFMGHIPKPWSESELSRPLIGKNKTTDFGALLKEYSHFIEVDTYREKNHESCVQIINDMLERLIDHPLEIARDMYYDLLIRTKRMSNRTELLDFALGKSESIAIFGSPNWLEWPKYERFYRKFIDNDAEMNFIHQRSRINLHDGVGFHFRAIDCMASGGLLFWYNDNDGDRYNTYQWKNPLNKYYAPEGLHSFFQKQFNYFEFKWLDFDDVYEKAKQLNYWGGKAQLDTLENIKAHHTWECRAQSIMKDIDAL
ncbi:hypothetical protein [Methylobacter tundripaludum]|uniref:hypothetical protein n=1 Tax=Methylobacter tundripaludum TaxID=173365 RepID=UPI000481371D|nr:hypothetical protein [Methylobacter tundripaludum]